MPEIKVWTEWEDGQARDEGQEKAELPTPENEPFDPADNRMQDVYGPPPFPLTEEHLPENTLWPGWDQWEELGEGWEEAEPQTPEIESFDPRDNRMQDVYGPPPFSFRESLLEIEDPLPPFSAEDWDDLEILRPEDNVPEVVYGPPAFLDWDEAGTQYFEEEDPWDADLEREGDGSGDSRPIRPKDTDSTPELIGPIFLEWE